VFVKEISFLSEGVKIAIERVRHEMWFDGENESFSADFFKNNILVRKSQFQYRTTKLYPLWSYSFKMLSCLLSQICWLFPQT
jgi:hypothetical protein